MEEHNQFISQERQFVDHQRFLANSADDGFYMEIDGMDQSKTNLPHWPNMPKNINKDLLMQIHVTGVRYSDGRCKGARLPCHVDLPWPHDPWVAHLLCATIVCYDAHPLPRGPSLAT